MDFKLRKWAMDDLEDLVRCANNAKVAGFLNDAFPHPYTVDDGRWFIEHNAELGNLYAIEINGSASGSIGIHPQRDVHRKNMELGYWLAEEFWGHGIVTEAVKKVVEITFSSPEIERIFARPFGSNIASQRVLEKAGFVLEAKLEKTIFKNGEYLDELIFAIRR